MRFLTRRCARECALQALYSWKLSNNNIENIENYIVLERRIQHLNISYFHELYIGVINSILEIDEIMIPYLSRDLKNLGYIEYLILCIAVFELTKCFNTPYKVIINEAIELTKIYGSEKSYKFINGVLDKMVSKLHFTNKL